MQTCLTDEWMRDADGDILPVCQGEEWIQKFVNRANAGNRSWLIRNTLVVGGNKAYDCVGWLRLLTGNNTYGSGSWTQALKAALPPQALRDNDRGKHVADNQVMPCGVCGQCKSVYPMLKEHAAYKGGQVVCVEPLPANYEVISRAAQQSGWKDALKMVQAAGSDAAGSGMTAEFPKSGYQFGFGAEAIGINDRTHWNGAEAQKVRLLSVDTLSDELRFVPDVLIIDAEGHDPAILAGARRTLSSARVGLLQFEVHTTGLWASTNVSTIVTELDKLGYTCYWSGKRYMHPVLPGQYVERQEKRKGEANIVCAHHAHAEWQHALGDSMSQETCRCLSLEPSSRTLGTPKGQRFRLGCPRAPQHHFQAKSRRYP